MPGSDVITTTDDLSARNVVMYLCNPSLITTATNLTDVDLIFETQDQYDR